MTFLRPDWEESPRPTIDCGPGKTKQNMKDETDINLIMARYQKTGLINFVNTRQAEYMNSNPVDFHQAMNIIAESNSIFADMPAYLRKKFNNDPGQFLDFVQNEENRPEMIELGLVERTPDDPPPVKQSAEPAPKQPPEVENAPQGAK